MNKAVMLYILGILLILSMSFVVADKVVTTEGTQGFTINTWQPHNVQQNTPYTFLWDISQYGMLIKSNLTNCTLFVNQNGVVSKYFQGVGTITSDGNAWYKTLTGGNFSELGHYNFQIDCYLLSNTSISGNALDSFDVTPTGENYSQPFLIALIIGMALISALLFYVTTLFKEDNTWIKLLFISLGLGGLILTAQIGLLGSNGSIISKVFLAAEVIMISAFSLFIAYLFIIQFKQTIQKLKNSKRNRIQAKYGDVTN